MQTIARLFGTIAVVGAILLIASPAMADDSISVEVRTIAASEDGDEVDPELADIQGRLERGITGYSSFQQIGRQSRTIDRSGSEDFELPTGDTLTLSYNGRADEFVKLGLALETRLDTTLRATPGSTFFQAGLSYNDATLVLAITVE